MYIHIYIYIYINILCVCTYIQDKSTYEQNTRARCSQRERQAGRPADRDRYHARRSSLARNVHDHLQASGDVSQTYFVGSFVYCLPTTPRAPDELLLHILCCQLQCLDAQV